MPTVFADSRLAPWTTVMPTAVRVFPEGDVLTITVPHTGGGSVAARLSGKGGEVVWEASGAPAGAAPAVQFIVPLDSLGCSVCDLTVENGHGSIRTTFGIVAPGADKTRQ